MRHQRKASSGKVPFLLRCILFCCVPCFLKTLIWLSSDLSEYYHRIMSYHFTAKERTISNVKEGVIEENKMKNIYSAQFSKGSISVSKPLRKTLMFCKCAYLSFNFLPSSQVPGVISGDCSCASAALSRLNTATMPRWLHPPAILF